MADLSVLVVGGGVGGLAASGILAKNGMKVTLLEKNACVGGRMQSMDWSDSHGRSFRFDTGPSLLLLPQCYRDAFSALGENIEDYVTIKRVEPAAYRIFFAEPGEPQSLDLLYDVQKMCSQLEHVEKGSSAEYLRFLYNAKQALDKGTENFIAKDFRSFWEYANILSLIPLLKHLSPFELLGQHHSRLSTYFKHPKLRALFTFQDLYVGLTPYNAPGVFSLLAATEITDGVWYPMGGFGNIRDGLTAAVTKAGVKIKLNLPVKQINHRQGKVRSVTLENGSVIEADIIVVNCDLPYVYKDILQNEGWRAKLHSRKIANSRFSAGVIAFNWALSTHIEGLNHHNVFLSDQYIDSWVRAYSPESFLQRPNFYVHAPSRTDPTCAPPDGDALTVLLPVANLAEGYAQGKSENDISMINAGRRAVLQTLSSAGLGNIKEFILNETVYTPYNWQSLYNLQHGAAFGLSHDFFQLAYFRPDIAEPHIKGVYFVGASTRPGNGVPLVLMGAKLTAERILEDYYNQ